MMWFTSERAYRDQAPARPGIAHKFHVATDGGRASCDNSIVLAIDRWTPVDDMLRKWHMLACDRGGCRKAFQNRRREIGEL